MVESMEVDSASVPEETQDAEAATIDELKEHTAHIQKAVAQKESRFILRILRLLPATRKKLNSKLLRKTINGFYTHDKMHREVLLSFVASDAEDADDTDAAQNRMRSQKSAHLALLPEVDVYLHLLLLVHMIDALEKAQSANMERAIRCAELLKGKVEAHSARRSMDLLAAKTYFYYSRVYELDGNLSSIRGFLLKRLRTATLRSDFEGQAVLINCLMRNYLHYSLFKQAAKLVSKVTFPEMASNNEWARYLYYLGCIKAIQLYYTDAHKNLLQAIRKAPQHSALGFKQTVYKLAVTVELLLGDIPDRTTFRQPALRKSLAPYFQLTQAVRTGNLGLFNQVLESYGARFQADHTYTLIIRLRHNVIKTGVRMINLSYQRISLADVAAKLQLGSAEDAEFIVAKAIRDGVIEATIDHDKGYVQSAENIDVYCTGEPQSQFDQRISFCLDIHNQSIKAMRFPPKSYNKDLESAEERREREQQDMEYAKELAEEDDDTFP
ncbi:26S proteasome non-ATPase regulatory subunit 3-like [Varroa jacobsoni]|uniref:PCI domain-containing protein n=1 Tax=Varroa destructor TaxID=109461 RepID=A0A7M7K4N6_VARDE|nr:26S proteasome non-ATPase regulatory subunit 3-like [Varroa destructor]XP_022660422.1 26S proteasome non-ATPase regulatory subunit 3-like [Varroa destructor]XP_022688496.1 26S proteasome non-ATPase regulatory subunit 3-like [Varroa jacobsoni]